MLEEMGFACVYFENYSRADYLKIASDYVGFVVRSKIRLDKEILNAASQLRFIARVGAGMENIDIAYAEQKGIACLHAPEGNRDAVAEQAIGMLLALFNNLLRADRQVRNGVWEREANRGLELGGKTIAIIGYGNTGGAFARKLSGFNAKVLAYDKYKTGFSDKMVEEASMDRIFADADVLSLHVPLTSETTYLVDKDYLERFAKPIYLINTARGKVVNTTDLIAAIETGIVSGACLDVLEFEKSSFESLKPDHYPQAFKKLIALEQLVLSPHIAGWTKESAEKMAAVLAQKIRKTILP